MEKFIWRTPRVCPICSTSFLPSTIWQISCSYKCGYTRQNAKHARATVNSGSCARCGGSLAHKRKDAIYCSDTCCSMDHTAKHRAKTRVQGVARRRIIWERDGGVCYLCKGQTIFGQFELDHLVPVSRGGDNSEGNIAVTHRSCNRSRGVRIEEAQLLKLLELRDKI
jgi:5-methylcytosine-specific restriction endonuclease McrA